MTETLTVGTDYLPEAEDLAYSAASGANTVIGHVRIIPGGHSAEVSTILRGSPPPWLSNVLRSVRHADYQGIISPHTLVRLAQLCASLPRYTPTPYVAVGDDETVGLEWDLDGLHIEVQLDNEADRDALLIEFAQGEAITTFELPLAGNALSLESLMTQYAGANPAD